LTLIVGVRCEDGVVMGADSAATLSALGQPTVRQQYDKVEIIGDKVLVAVSGPVGLGQRLVGELANAWTNKKLTGESWEVMTTLRRLFMPHLEDEFKAAQVAQPVVGALARESVLSHTLAAMPVKKEPRLFQFDHQGAPEEAKEKLPFVCIGSGQYLADPFMAFIAELFWQKGKFPSLPDGVFATVWTIEHAISVAPGGIAGPVQVHILAKDDSDWMARRLEDSDLQEHYQAIADARSALQRFRTGFEPGEQDVPLPPSPT
jgi:ATP-dependent protease HslVU (ClpYQ) peptidase subunit